MLAPKTQQKGAFMTSTDAGHVAAVRDTLGPELAAHILALIQADAR